MNRPLTLRLPHARPRPTPTVQGAGWVPDERGSLVTAMMVWVLIIYLVVPVQYFVGDLNITNDASMGAPNPLARTIKLGLLALSAVIVLWRARLALVAVRSVNPFFLAFLALVPMAISA